MKRSISESIDGETFLTGSIVVKQYYE